MPVTFRTIVCAVDLSAFSRTVLNHGRYLAQAFGARMIVFHAIAPPRPGLGEQAIVSDPGAWTGPGPPAAEQLQAFMRDFPGNWDLELTTGDPVERLSALCPRVGANLVIAASHGLSGFRRMIIGTVVERFARIPKVPLLLLRMRHATERPPGPAPPVRPQRIAAACRLQPDDEPLIASAAHWATALDSELLFLHALERPYDEHLADTPTAPYQQAQANLLNQKREELEDEVRTRLPEALRFNVRLAPGAPAETLIAELGKWKAHLAVVGVRQHRFLARRTLGATTEALLRHAPCHILTIPLATERKRQVMAGKGRRASDSG